LGSLRVYPNPTPLKIAVLTFELFVKSAAIHHPLVDGWPYNGAALWAVDGGPPITRRIRHVLRPSIYFVGHSNSPSNLFSN